MFRSRGDIFVCSNIQRKANVSSEVRVHNSAISDPYRTLYTGILCNKYLKDVSYTFFSVQ